MSKLISTTVALILILTVTSPARATPYRGTIAALKTSAERSKARIGSFTEHHRDKLMLGSFVSTIPFYLGSVLAPGVPTKLTFAAMTLAAQMSGVYHAFKISRE